jgi:Fur family ferric uptake transcriptional regulator
VLERSTRQQTAILETLEGLDEFRSAQEIYLALTKKKFKVGLATVYRVLTQFEAAGLVTRHHFADGMAVFELNEGAHHDHILCLDCGHVEEFMDAGIEERQTAVAGRLGFEISEHALVIYGHCRRQECPHRSAPKV